MNEIEYSVVAADEVSLDELMEFYREQKHETTASAAKLALMLKRSHVLVIARENGMWIGFARGVTDGVRGYLAECKLDPAYQGPAAVTRKDGRIEHDDRGIARELALRVLESLRDAGVERIFVTAHGTEEDFCRELGFKPLRGAVAMDMDPQNLRAREPATVMSNG